MSKEVLVPIADGVEEIEAVCIIDILRRSGASVTVASVDELAVTASRGVGLIADRLIADCADVTFDLIALPGGMPGAEHLRDSQELVSMLKRQRDEGRLYAAICAAPVVVLQHHGLLEGRKATCHPGVVDSLEDAGAAATRVVVDGPCVTSRGPGTAIEFALTLVGLLFDDETAQAIQEATLAAC
jgi:4-methyl-5(b-hydroxyethyl)-thiazole monophosphate biosynthesis